MNTCSSCAAKIIWVVTASGKPMPCDATPLRVAIATGRSVDIGHGPQPEYEVRVGYQSHFASCPNSDQHRKPKSPPPGGVR